MLLCVCLFICFVVWFVSFICFLVCFFIFVIVGLVVLSITNEQCYMILSFLVLTGVMSFVSACEKGNTYGANCEKYCTQRHCYSSSTSCDVQTGSCGVSGCQTAWEGNDCAKGIHAIKIMLYIPTNDVSYTSVLIFVLEMSVCSYSLSARTKC